MYCQDSLSIDVNKLLKISFVGIDTEPKLIFIKKHTIKAIIKSKNESLYVFVLVNYSKALKK